MPSILLKVAALVLLLAIGAIIATSCIPGPGRRMPPAAPPTPEAVRPDILTRDLAGRPRNPRSGITPGALAAEPGRASETNAN